MLSSSIQATLIGRYGQSDYGKSEAGGGRTVLPVWQRERREGGGLPLPESHGPQPPEVQFRAISTFCWAVANDEPFTVNDRSTELELLYIDDLIEGMFDLLEGKEAHCEYDGLNPVPTENGRYCYVPTTHKVTLGEIVDLLQEFKSQPATLLDAQDAGRLFCPRSCFRCT